VTPEPDWHSERGRAALARLADDLARCPYMPERAINGYMEMTRPRLHGHNRNLPAPRTALSPGEARALQLLSDGLRPPTIARVLGLSSWTVRTQLKFGRRKLAARNPAHAVALALRAGLID
jgi:DNA-binding CsgD family transcriptional regulator